MQKLALIKLGGSVVTFKDRALAPNVASIDRISRVLAKLEMPAIIVHGGGSFGHYWSMKYNMHTKPARYNSHGISIVHESMVALNQIIVNSMMAKGLNPYGIPPSVLTENRRPLSSQIRRVSEMAMSKVIPVTFGDVVHTHAAKYSILSGDALMTILALGLRPSKVIFATNVDGIYKDMVGKEIVRQIRVTEKKSINYSKGMSADATGGMKRKVTEAFKIASCGMEVLIVNGLVPNRITEAIEDRLGVGTVIKGRKR